MLEYEALDEETKDLIRKATNIYHTIKNRKLRKKADLSKHEKKIMSLFISCFLMNGDIKEILSKYNDIKIIDLSFFMNTDVLSIPSPNFNEEEYKNFYYDNFYEVLDEIIMSSYYIVDKITPEVIFSLLNQNNLDSDIFSSTLDSWFGILDKFSKRFLKLDHIYDHPAFNDVNRLAQQKGDMTLTIEIPKKEKESDIQIFCIDLDNDDQKQDSDKKSYISHFPNFLKVGYEPLEMDPKKEEHVQFLDDDSIDIHDAGIWDILDEIKLKFIGQEKALEDLFYNIINNQQLAQRDDINDGERSIIFIDGPTGTGKTAMVREITDKLGIPFTATSATNYSSTGYVGGNITDTLDELVDKCKGDLDKAQRGIIVFDEFDKIAYSREGGLEMKRAVQQQLLDFMGGGKYEVSLDINPFMRIRETFDTSKITFICLGALTDLRKDKTKTNKSIGFNGSTSLDDTSESYSIRPQDLMDIGLEPELVGRFNTFIHTEEYSKEMLTRILKESELSPIHSLKRLAESNGKQLVIESEVYETIASMAYELNTGARSLQTIVSSVRTPLLREFYKGKDEIVYLTNDMIKKLNEDVFSRKVRK